MEENESPLPIKRTSTAKTKPKPPAASRPSKPPGHGGARTGAGRKPPAVSAAEKKAAQRAQVQIEKAAAQAVAEQEAQAAKVIEEIPLAVAVSQARKRIGARYPFILDQLLALVEGATQITRRWELAQTIMVEEWLEPDTNGKQAKTKKQLFPEAKPDEMVLVMEQRVTYPPDAATTQFLFNRLAGRPAEEKSNPLDEDGAGTGEEQTREDAFMDFFEVMLSRMAERRKSAQGAAPSVQQGAPAQAQPAPALTAPAPESNA